ncbi:MAG: MATE family efflux transporter [Lachnospiraceae bacterium]
MAGNRTKDLTVGSPLRLILGFCIPVVLGNLFQQFYSLVDTVIVGRVLGVDALAAVGSTGSVCFMIMGFCMGVCSGFAIPVAQRFGAGDYVGMRKMVVNSMWLCIVFSVIMTIVSAALCRQILVWMKTPENIIEDAYAYLFVVFLSIPVIYLYNMLSGIIRSLGDSRTPFVFLVIASALNIVLDYVLMVPIKWGVAGASWATLISQAVSGILCLFYMKRKFLILKLSREEWEADGHCMGILCGMGIPMGLQYSITAIGSVILQAAVNGLGSASVAAMAAGSKISMFFSCPFEAMGATLATYGGQNVGAKKLDRVGQGLKAGNIIGGIYSLLAFGILFFFGNQLARLFIESGKEYIVEEVMMVLLSYGGFYIALSVLNNTRFLIQGMGFSKFAILAGVFEMGARGIIGFWFVPRFGFFAACLAGPAAWVMADLFLIPAYYRVKHKLHRLFEEGYEAAV